MSQRVFSDIIREAIKGLGITQKQFAASIGVDPATVTKWIKGTQLPRPSIVSLLAETAGIEEIELLQAINFAERERANLAERKAARTDRESDRVLTRVGEFVQTYEAFHAAYRQMGEQLDVLVEQVEKLANDVADVKRDVRSIRSKGPR